MKTYSKRIVKFVVKDFRIFPISLASPVWEKKVIRRAFGQAVEPLAIIQLFAFNSFMMQFLSKPSNVPPLSVHGSARKNYRDAVTVNLL